MRTIQQYRKTAIQEKHRLKIVHYKLTSLLRLRFAISLALRHFPSSLYRDGCAVRVSERKNLSLLTKRPNQLPTIVLDEKLNENRWEYKTLQFCLTNNFQTQLTPFHSVSDSRRYNAINGRPYFENVFVSQTSLRHNSLLSIKKYLLSLVISKY